MADEPQVPVETPAAENAPAVEDNSQGVSPTNEQKTSDNQQVSDTDNQTTDSGAVDETSDASDNSERKPSRAERKIRDQHRQLKDLQAELEQTRQNQIGQSPDIPLPSIDYGQELTPEQYQQHVVQAANAIAQLQVKNQLAQFEAKANLDADVKTLPQEFPEFDDKSEQFNPELLAEVEEAYKARAFRTVGTDASGRPIQVLDPNVRLGDVARSYAKAARSAATRQTANVTASVAKAADDTSPRPGPQAPRVEREFKDLSLEEMKAQLGYHKM